MHRRADDRGKFATAGAIHLGLERGVLAAAPGRRLGGGGDDRLLFGRGGGSLRTGSGCGRISCSAENFLEAVGDLFATCGGCGTTRCRGGVLDHGLTHCQASNRD